MSAHDLSLRRAEFAAPAAARADQRPRDRTADLLVIAVAAYLLVAVGRVHQLFPVLEVLRPALVAGVVAILIYLLDRRPERRLAWTWSPATYCLVALTVWMALSVPTALVRSTSFELFVDNFLKTAVMFFVIAGAARGVRDVERFAVAYFAAAAVYAAVIAARFDVGTGQAWRLGDLYYYDANDFATFAVTAMPLGLYAVASARTGMMRLIGGAALALLALVFVWTGSRGGFIALVAMAAYVVVRYRAVPLRWRLLGTGVVGIVILAGASERYWSQMETILSENDYNRTEETGRLQIWGRGIGYTLGNPLLGVGAGNFPAAEGLLSPHSFRQQLGVGVRWNAAHNSFIQVAAEMGLPGLAAFVGLFVAAFLALRRASRRARRPARDPRVPPLAQALTAALIGFVVGGFFLSLAYSEMLYTLIALAVALDKVTRFDARARREQDAHA